MTGDDYEEMKSRLAEQAEEMRDGWMHAQVDLECDVCGLNIHVGDPITLGANGWVHPLCDADYALSVIAEQQGDADRERGA